MNDTPRPRFLERFRTRRDRLFDRLDAEGRLGDPPAPWRLAFAVAGLVSLLGLTSFALGRYSAGTPLLVFLVIPVIAIGFAVGTALIAGERDTVTQLDEARAQLLAMHSDLELLRGEFEALAHDTKAITAAMGAAVHALERGGADPTIVSALESQLATLRALLKPATVRLDVIRPADLQAPLEGFAALHGLDLDSDLPSEVQVRADLGATTQILQNLLDNARKYAPGSPIRIWHEPAGPYHRIVVEDEGPGVAGDSETVFLPGVRSDSRAQGFGMGLTSARRMAEAMHGALWYESRPSGGARFVLKLMAHESEREPVR